MPSYRKRLNIQIQALKERHDENPTNAKLQEIKSLEKKRKNSAARKKKARNIRAATKKQKSTKDPVRDLDATKDSPSSNRHLDDPTDTVLDNDSIGDFGSPDPTINLNVLPEHFSIPTPVPTISSPTTDTVSTLKRGESVGKGSMEDVVIVDDLVTMAADEADRDDRMQKKYEELLLSQDPIALTIEDLIKFLDNKPRQIVEGFPVTKYSLMQLFEGIWLDHEMVNMYAEIVAREDPHIQVLQSTKVTWELMAINDPKGPEAKNPQGFVVEGETTSLLIPTFVNENHWMLCVARLPSTTTSVGNIEYFNSLNSTFFTKKCREAAEDVGRVLSWLGSLADSRLANITWRTIIVELKEIQMTAVCLWQPALHQWSWEHQRQRMSTTFGQSWPAKW